VMYALLSVFCLKNIWYTFHCPGFTGVDSVYEAPSNPDLVLKAGAWSVSECVEHVINMLEKHVRILSPSSICLVLM